MYLFFFKKQLLRDLFMNERTKSRADYSHRFCNNAALTAAKFFAGIFGNSAA